LDQVQLPVEILIRKDFVTWKINLRRLKKHTVVPFVWRDEEILHFYVDMELVNVVLMPSQLVICVEHRSKLKSICTKLKISKRNFALDAHTLKFLDREPFLTIMF